MFCASWARMMFRSGWFAMAIEGMEVAAREIGARKLEKLTRVNGALRGAFL